MGGGPLSWPHTLVTELPLSFEHTWSQLCRQKTFTRALEIYSYLSVFLVLHILKMLLSDEHLSSIARPKTSKLGEEYIMLFITTEMRKKGF